MILTSYNNVQIPVFVYGTAWKKERTTELVDLAVESGFRAIDTANQIIHYDEARVGQALKSLKQRGYPVQELFLQTKFTPVNGQDHRTPYDRRANPAVQVKQSMDSSLDHLGVEHVDSYLLHGPYSRGALTAADLEVWSAMEALLEAGKTRMIGISNVSAAQLRELCRQADVKPMVVQNRCYAITGWDQEVRNLCREHGIIYQAFSLLTANTAVLNDAAVQGIAARLSATPAQVIFSFSIRAGMQPMTGTTDARHMQEDLAAIHLELTDEEVREIESSAVHAH